MGPEYETGCQTGLEPVWDDRALGASPGAEVGVTGAASVGDAALRLHPLVAVPEAGVCPQQRKPRCVAQGRVCWVWGPGWAFGVGGCLFSLHGMNRD